MARFNALTLQNVPTCSDRLKQVGTLRASKNAACSDVPTVPAISRVHARARTRAPARAHTHIHIYPLGTVGTVGTRHVNQWFKCSDLEKKVGTGRNT